MKTRLLDFLVCPNCNSDLELHGTATDGDRIREGNLACRSCSAAFPIKDYIPRFVDTDKYVDSFSFEWNKFYDVQMDILNNTDESERTFEQKTGWKPEDMKGKLVLDVGVGAGRFADVVSRWGGEVVGIDLSFAVNAAYKNIGKRENVHIIQADIFHLPLKKESFDHMYSIGVLHHTPDTKKAFTSLVPYLKPGGSFAVYIYEKNRLHKYSDLWRTFTTKLSARSLYYLSALAIPAYYLFRIPLAGPRLHYWFPMSIHLNRRVRWLDTFDWYSPKFQSKHSVDEVKEWYEECGFKDIEVYQFPVCMKGKKG